MLELLGKEWRHVALQPAVHDQAEVASHGPKLVECLHTVLTAVLQGHVVHLQMLEVCLGVDVGVLVREDLLVVPVPADLGPGVTDHPAGEADGLARLHPPVPRTVHHVGGHGSMDQPLPLLELGVGLKHQLALDSLHVDRLGGPAGEVGRRHGVLAHRDGGDFADLHGEDCPVIDDSDTVHVGSVQAVLLPGHMRPRLPGDLHRQPQVRAGQSLHDGVEVRGDGGHHRGPRQVHLVGGHQGVAPATLVPGRHTEVVALVRLQIKRVKLWDGRAAELHPEGPLAAEPGLHLVGDDRGAAGHERLLPAERGPAGTHLRGRFEGE